MNSSRNCQHQPWKEDCFLPSEVAVKYTYDHKTQRWQEERVSIQLRPCPISEGTNRRVFLMRDLSLHAEKQKCVAKVSKELIEGRKEYFADVIMQAKCSEFADEFNSRNPPKKVRFLQPYVVELIQRPHDRTGGPPLMLVEPFLDGKYLKHSNNWGFVDPADRNTPQAFSHFTYHHSRGSCIVVDIQGVNDIYTDPQIHSNQPTELPPVYGQGDMACQGIAKFFESHKCNVICGFLGLPAVSPRVGSSSCKGTVIAPGYVEPCAPPFSRSSSLGSVSSEEHCKKNNRSKRSPLQLDIPVVTPSCYVHSSPFTSVPVVSFSSPMIPPSPTVPYGVLSAAPSPLTFWPRQDLVGWSSCPVIALC
jgi:hypothetical protein